MFETCRSMTGASSLGALVVAFSLVLLPACSSTSGGSGPEPGTDGAAQGDAADAAGDAADGGVTTSLDGESFDGPLTDASPDATGSMEVDASPDATGSIEADGSADVTSADAASADASAEDGGGLAMDAAQDSGGSAADAPEDDGGPGSDAEAPDGADSGCASQLVVTAVSGPSNLSVSAECAGSAGTNPNAPGVIGSQQITIRNPNASPVSWTAQVSTTYFSIDNQGGTLDQDETATVTVSAVALSTYPPSTTVSDTVLVTEGTTAGCVHTFPIQEGFLGYFFTPPTLDFGNVALTTTSSSMHVTANFTGGPYSAGVLSASPSPEFSGSVTRGTTPITGLDVTFSPAALGLRQGTVTFSGANDPVCTAPIALTGTGTNGSCASAPTGSPCLTAGVCVESACTTQLHATGSDFAFTPGSSLTTTVGTVTDALTSDTASSLSVSIAWGDGSTSAGVVSGTASPFTLSGTHTYASAALVSGTVTVTDSTTGNSATTTFAAGPQITVTPYSTGANYPAGIASGSDGNLWFPADQKIYYATTSGVVSHFIDTQIYTQDDSSILQDIVLGPDGNVWYATGGGVDRSTPTGTIATFSTTGAPGWFTASSSAVWFTEEDIDKVASLSSSGTLSEFPVTAQSSPQAIAFGADGNVWFWEAAAQNIGRMSTTGGNLSEFPASTTTNVSVSAMIAGPDGNVWLATSESSFIRVAPDETITTFPIPGATGNAGGGLAIDGNGDLWTTSWNFYWLARITTSGTVSVYFVPNLSLGAITSGSDGNLWAIDTATAQVVRITLPP